MSQERAIELAMQLLQLGVSRRGVEYLLSHFPYDTIDKQLSYLRFRKAKRPEAFIIEAIRHDYSAPKEAFYAPNTPDPAEDGDPVDENSEHTGG